MYALLPSWIRWVSLSLILPLLLGMFAISSRPHSHAGGEEQHRHDHGHTHGHAHSHAAHDHHHHSHHSHEHDRSSHSHADEVEHIHVSWLGVEWTIVTSRAATAPGGEHATLARPQGGSHTFLLLAYYGSNLLRSVVEPLLLVNSDSLVFLFGVEHGRERDCPPLPPPEQICC